MNTALKLYNIHKEVEEIINDENLVNQETGEFTEEGLKRFESLQLVKSDIVKSLALANVFHNAQAEMVNGEIKRLQSIKKSFESRANAVKKLLQGNLQEGEKYEFDTVKISWRKSEAVEADELLDLSKQEYHLVTKPKIIYELDKNLIKSMVKQNMPIPEGIRVIEKQNLQIK